MPKFRKKPVVIEAEQFQGGIQSGHTLVVWINQNGGTARYSETQGYLDIQTLEGVMRAEANDWIIRGVKGEFYPCKPDIFESTYDLVDDTTQSEATEPDTEVNLSVEFTSFIRKPFRVSAVEITVENIHELADLIGEFKEDLDSGPYIIADPEKVPTVSRVIPGYWITQMGKNLRCYSAKAFHEQFTTLTPSLDRLMRKVDEDTKEAVSA